MPEYNGFSFIYAISVEPCLVLSFGGLQTPTRQLPSLPGPCLPHALFVIPLHCPPRVDFTCAKPVMQQRQLQADHDQVIDLWQQQQKVQFWQQATLHQHELQGYISSKSWVLLPWSRSAEVRKRCVEICQSSCSGNVLHSVYWMLQADLRRVLLLREQHD